MKILLVDIPSRRCAIVISSSYGSRYESKKTNGIFHLTEHVIPQGSVLSPTGDETDQYFDAIAGTYNAYTTPDSVSFCFELPSSHIIKGINLAAEMIRKPLLQDRTIRTERRAISEEIHDSQDSPTDMAYDLAMHAVFDGHPLAFPIMGTKANISGFTREDVEKTWKRIITPSQMVIVVIGGFDPDRMKKKITYLFGGLQKTVSIITPRPYTITQKRRKISRPPQRSKKLKQVIFHLLFPTFSRDNPMFPPLTVLNKILGGKPSSRLYQRLRNGHGLVYSVHSDIIQYQDIGCIDITTACVPDNVIPVLRIILEEISELTHALITSTELRETLNHLKGQSIVMSANPLQQAEFYCRQIHHLGLFIPTRPYNQSISRVTRSQILSVAQSVFKNETLNLSIVGPVNNCLLDKIRKIAKIA